MAPPKRWKRVNQPRSPSPSEQGSDARDDSEQLDIGPVQQRPPVHAPTQRRPLVDRARQVELQIAEVQRRAREREMRRSRAATVSATSNGAGCSSASSHSGRRTQAQSTSPAPLSDPSAFQRRNVSRIEDRSRAATASATAQSSSTSSHSRRRIQLQSVSTAPISDHGAIQRRNGSPNEDRQIANLQLPLDNSPIRSRSDQISSYQNRVFLTSGLSLTQMMTLFHQYEQMCLRIQAVVNSHGYRSFARAWDLRKQLAFEQVQEIVMTASDSREASSDTANSDLGGCSTSKKRKLEHPSNESQQRDASSNSSIRSGSEGPEHSPPPAFHDNGSSFYYDGIEIQKESLVSCILSSRESFEDLLTHIHTAIADYPLWHDDNVQLAAGSTNENVEVLARNQSTLDDLKSLLELLPLVDVNDFKSAAFLETLKEFFRFIQDKLSRLAKYASMIPKRPPADP